MKIKVAFLLLVIILSCKSETIKEKTVSVLKEKKPSSKSENVEKAKENKQLLSETNNQNQISGSHSEPEVVTYTYDPAGKRDPFKPVISKVDKKKEMDLLLPLQKIEISDLKVIGVVWGEFGYNAVVQAKDGKGYIIKIGTLIGRNNGKVKKITSKEVIINETFINLLGEKRSKDVKLELHTEEEKYR